MVLLLKSMRRLGGNISVCSFVSPPTLSRLIQTQACSALGSQLQRRKIRRTICESVGQNDDFPLPCEKSLCHFGDSHGLGNGTHKAPPTSKNKVRRAPQCWKIKTAPGKEEKTEKKTSSRHANIEGRASTLLPHWQHPCHHHFSSGRA